MHLFPNKCWISCCKRIFQGNFKLDNGTLFRIIYFFWVKSCLPLHENLVTNSFSNKCQTGKDVYEDLFENIYWPKFKWAINNTYDFDGFRDWVYQNYWNFFLILSWYIIDSRKEQGENINFFVIKHMAKITGIIW